jgi:hypothetical protein
MIGPEAKASVPALIEALKDENRWIREAVSDALIEINTPEALKLLEDYKKCSNVENRGKQEIDQFVFDFGIAMATILNFSAGHQNVNLVRQVVW